MILQGNESKQKNENGEGLKITGRLNEECEFEIMFDFYFYNNYHSLYQ